MKKTGFAKTACIVAAFCLVAAASPAQTFTVLTEFDGTNGGNSTGALTQGSNGNFYGAAAAGGADGLGTVFDVTSAGALTTLHGFCVLTGCPDCAGPGSALLLAANGNFYGTTQGGGDLEGTVLKSLRLAS